MSESSHSKIKSVSGVWDAISTIVEIFVFSLIMGGMITGTGQTIFIWWLWAINCILPGLYIALFTFAFGISLLRDEEYRSIVLESLLAIRATLTNRTRSQQFNTIVLMPLFIVLLIISQWFVTSIMLIASLMLHEILVVYLDILIISLGRRISK